VPYLPSLSLVVVRGECESARNNDVKELRNRAKNNMILRKCRQFPKLLHSKRKKAGVCIIYAALFRPAYLFTNLLLVGSCQARALIGCRLSVCSFYREEETADRDTTHTVGVSCTLIVGRPTSRILLHHLVIQKLSEICE